MFGAKKKERPKRDHTGRSLEQYGIFGVSNDGNVEGGSDDDDSDLEAELLALSGGGKPKQPPRSKPKVPEADLDAMVAASMQDIPSDAELSGDDDDPDLLNELGEITGETTHEEPEVSPEEPQANDATKLLNERLKMYEEAEQNAKTTGETSRARRFTRGIGTLKDLIKQANAGKPINPDDIPPEVSTGTKKPQEGEAEVKPEISRPAPAPPKPQTPETPVEEVKIEEPKVEIDQNLIKMLTERRNEYKVAALEAKKLGDHTQAIQYVKTAKQFDHVISAAEAGQPVDLSKMPGPPGKSIEGQGEKVHENREKTEENQIQTGSAEADEPEEQLVMASSVAEALEQRLDVYKQQEQAAKDKDNASKARRMGRIVKQYEDAIKMHKLGKPIPVDELPTPPGYGPIPVDGATAPTQPSTSQAPKPAPPRPARPTPQNATVSPKPESTTTRITGNHVPNSRADKQLALLLAKQKEFKEAALNAKRRGEMEQAKEFLRTAKGFDPLIDAASCGLPVDLATIPVSPSAKSQLDNEYDIVMSEDATPSTEPGSDGDMLSRLETQLTKQLKMCLSTRDHHKALGDVAGTNRFERLALNVTKDLDLVRAAKKSGASIPKFHYETKEFNIVKSFTELNDNDMELSIARGISYACNNPKDIDTYVKFEFPYPQEQPFAERTATIKNTNNPEYNATYTIPIQRTARTCQRVFKRHSIKFEVYSKGCIASDYLCCFSGFLRGDTLLGTATVKLQPLETQCELHDSFDLIEGRKKVGGKLEVKLRLRHPIVSQQVEQIREKWLILDT